ARATTAGADLPAPPDRGAGGRPHPPSKGRTNVLLPGQAGRGTSDLRTSSVDLHSSVGFAESLVPVAVRLCSEVFAATSLRCGSRQTGAKRALPRRGRRRNADGKSTLCGKPRLLDHRGGAARR